MAKTQRKRCSRTKAKDSTASEAPRQFGDLITADHVVFNQRDMSHDCKKYLLTIYDRATAWLEATPCPTKDAHVTTMALKDFAGTTSPKLFYSDNSGELKEAAGRLTWLHDLQYG